MWLGVASRIDSKKTRDCKEIGLRVQKMITILDPKVNIIWLVG